MDFTTSVSPDTNSIFLIIRDLHDFSLHFFVSAVASPDPSNFYFIFLWKFQKNGTLFANYNASAAAKERRRKNLDTSDGRMLVIRANDPTEWFTRRIFERSVQAPFSRNARFEKKAETIPP